MQRQRQKGAGEFTIMIVLLLVVGVVSYFYGKAYSLNKISQASPSPQVLPDRSNDSSDMVSYESIPLGFTLKYPRNEIDSIRDAENGGVSFTKNKNGNKDYMWISFSTGHTLDGEKLEQVINQDFAQNAKNFADKVETNQINGITTYSFNANFDDTHIYIPEDEKRYWLVVIHTTDQNSRKIGENILSTFIKLP